MRTIKIQIKSFSFFLSMLVIFQSCTVYKSTAVTLDEAAKEEIKTKVETNNGVNIKFKHIVFEDGNYFGIRKFKRKIQKIELNKEHIKSVRLKNKTVSTILTLSVIAIPIVTIIGVASQKSTCKNQVGMFCFDDF